MEKLAMRFFVNLLCLGLLSLDHFTLASVILQENPDWYLQERGDIPLTEAGFVDVYEKGAIRHLLVTTFSDKCADNDSVQVLNSTILEHFTPNLIKGGLCHPRSVQRVPATGQEFKSLDITISYGDSIATNDAFGGIILADFSDFTKPNFHDLSPRQSSTEYNNPVWRSREEFFVCQFNGISKGPIKWGLKRFSKSPWKETLVKGGFCDSNMAMFKSSGHPQFEVLYAISKLDQKLKFIWPEESVRKPGDWKIPGHLKERVIATENFVDIKLVDLNIDKKLDLLLSVETGEVWAYEFPEEGFRKAENYKVHKLAKNFKASTGKSCPFVLKTFIPFGGYTGKPWLLVSGGQCGSAAYLVPESQSSENWDYKRFTILNESNESSVFGVEAVDIDGDGTTEFFISLNDRNVIKVLSLTNVSSTNATDLTTATASFTVAATNSAATTTTTTMTTTTKGSTIGDRMTTATSHSSATSSSHSVTGNSPMFLQLASSLSSPEDDDDGDDRGNFTSDSSVSTNAGHDTSFDVTPANDSFMTTVSNNNDASSPSAEFESTGTTGSTDVENTSVAETTSWSAGENTADVVTSRYNATTSGEFKSSGTTDSVSWSADDGPADMVTPRYNATTSGEFESSDITDSTGVENTSAAETISWSAGENTEDLVTPGFNAGSSSSIPDEVGLTSTDSITASSDDDNRSTVKNTSTIESVTSSPPSEEIEGTRTDSEDGMTSATHPTDANNFTSSSFAAAVSDVGVTLTSGSDNNFTVESISTDVRSSIAAAAAAAAATTTESLTPADANAITTAAVDGATISSPLTAGDLSDGDGSTTHRCNSTPGSSILDEVGSASTDSSYGSTTVTFTDDNNNNVSSSSSNFFSNSSTSYIHSPDVSVNIVFSLPSTDDDSSNVTTDASSTPDAGDDLTSPVWKSTSRARRIHSTTKATTMKSNSGLKSYAGCSVFVLPVVYIFMGR